MTQNYVFSVDIKNIGRGLDLKNLSLLGPVQITATSLSFEDALRFTQNEASLLDIFCDCSALQDTDHIINLLNAGCTKIHVDKTNLKRLIEENGLDKEHLSRLILSLTPFNDTIEAGVAAEALELIDMYSRYVPQGLCFCGGLDLIRSVGSALKEESSKPIFYVKLTTANVNLSTTCVHEGAIAVVPSEALTNNLLTKEKLFPLYRLITDVLRSDRPDGLFPTVVSDDRGVCLGMVYSNQQSVAKALELGRGVYYSRSRKKLWIKGEESGNFQELVNISMDCDADALQFRVRQAGDGFCHTGRATCFGSSDGISRLEKTLYSRKVTAPKNSYTARLFSEPKLLQAKIMEEAHELCEATSKGDVADEAADLIYFAMTKCVKTGVNFKDVEKSLDLKSLKITRRKGDAKPHWAEQMGLTNVDKGTSDTVNGVARDRPVTQTLEEAASVPKAIGDPSGFLDGKIRMRRYDTARTSPETIVDVLQRPSQRATDEIMNIVKPIINRVRDGGDGALLTYTHKFEKAVSLTTPVLKAPFPEHLMALPPKTIEAIDTSFKNISCFHAAQKEEKPLQVETMPGVNCSRFSRPIERVGLYVPGGTAVLPSTALMLGVPAMVAGCKRIVLASPPRSDGTITPEIVYVANKIGAESIILAGGAQAVAALAYGTESISKVDKILGPGNQFVTAGKMIVSNDTTAGVSIDMPAGPSEVLVIADKTAKPAFVACDLLSQAEHGTDSQVVLIAINLDETDLAAIEDELHTQAHALPRVDIVRGAIEHSVTLVVKTIEEAMRYSNQYAPEHLILQVENAQDVVKLVQNAGSVFVGPWTPESVGDYSAGVNHSLRKFQSPLRRFKQAKGAMSATYGYAKQYSGVNLSSFTKHITSSKLTREGLKNISGAVMELARVEELEAHRRAVGIRLDHMT
ncbi:uncharacterized protein KY384_001548 [Bacidia gigantensis]|uniref:uncharacterized protein n=1 Tax=Bacidia gigantensis TaxID=2732470 RepID=UPI001D03EDC1|nr:uncharacterized protein KY384_001548 [Bacidia gigantensis]KAG8533807.1 hypothetical protein KY384_001548 [Bacidia gigantensis]